MEIILRDGFLEVMGFCPGLDRKLRYFRKSLELVGHQRRVVRGFEDLYDEPEPGHVTTMPGFAHRVLDHCRENGIPFTFRDERTPFPEPDYGRAFQGLRPYQIPLVGRMLSSSGGILRASTGAGKTCISASVIRAFDRGELCSRHTPTCVFACPDRDINRKNFDEFRRWLPGRDVGLVMSGARCVPSDDVVCCTIDSLEHLDPDSVGIIIVDEMHASASQARAEKISLFRKARRWGVSATPTGRFDGADLVSEGLYGPIVAEFSYKDGVASGALVPITVCWLKAPPPACGLETYGAYKSRDAKIRHGSTANEAFAKMAAAAVSCAPESVQVLGIMQFIEQMGFVKRFCADRVGVVHAETNQGKLRGVPGIGAIRPAERKALYDAFREGSCRAMLSTSVWSTGVDFPGLDVVVNIGGGGSEIAAKQIPGRASRKSAGKDHAYVVDFMHPWDWEDPVVGSGSPGPLLSNDYARRKAYTDLGFEQIEFESVEKLPYMGGKE